MAERDTEIDELKARIAELEARPIAEDLDWLKNSDVWKRAQFAASPGWRNANIIFIGLGLSAFLVYAVIAFTR